MGLAVFLFSLVPARASVFREQRPIESIIDRAEPKANIAEVLELQTYHVLLKTKDVRGRVFHHQQEPFAPDAKVQEYVLTVVKGHFYALGNNRVIGISSYQSYYGYRWYDASNGRWINRDPIKEDGGLNVYNFCNGDPINHVDVLGQNTLAMILKKLVEAGGKVGRNAVINIKFAGKKVTWEMLDSTTGICKNRLAILKRQYSGLVVHYTKYGRPMFHTAKHAGKSIVYSTVHKGKKISGKFVRPGGFVNSTSDIRKAWQSISDLPAKELARLKKTHVWHHDWDGNTLYLIPKVIHSSYRHTGGIALKNAGLCASSFLTIQLMDESSKAEQIFLAVSGSVAGNTIDQLLSSDAGSLSLAQGASLDALNLLDPTGGSIEKIIADPSDANIAEAFANLHGLKTVEMVSMGRTLKFLKRAVEDALIHSEVIWTDQDYLNWANDLKCSVE